MNEGEPLGEAAARELQEETGVEVLAIAEEGAGAAAKGGSSSAPSITIDQLRAYGKKTRPLLLFISFSLPKPPLHPSLISSRLLVPFKKKQSQTGRRLRHELALEGEQQGGELMIVLRASLKKNLSLLSRFFRPWVSLSHTRFLFFLPHPSIPNHFSLFPQKLYDDLVAAGTIGGAVVGEDE